MARSPSADHAPKLRERRRWHWVLLTVPFLWCIAAIPVVNQVHATVGPVPFLLVWMAAGAVAGSGCVAVVYAIDRRNGELDRI